MSGSVRGIAPSLIKIALFTVVTVFATGVLGATIASVNFGPKTGYTAVFTTASGLGPGDGVRIAGVKVGTVTSVKALEINGRNRAKVHFTVKKGVELPELVTATVKYKNLIGARYLALGTDVPHTGQTLPEGGRIPVERTDPALNLTKLFNGFKPLFQALNPKQINTLTKQIIAVFQGQSSTVQSLLAHVASLTSTIAKKDKVIGQVITNLNQVLNKVVERGPELGELVEVTQKLVSGLAEQRKSIGKAVAALDELTNTTASLLSRVREPLHKDLKHLKRLSENLLQADELLKHLLEVTPQNLADFTNALSYGSWYNYYLCGLTVRLGYGEHYIEVPILPLPGSARPPRCGP